MNHELVFKKVHRVIKFNQNAWLKPYIDMIIDLTKKAKNDFERHRDIKLVTKKKKKKELFSIRTKLSNYKVFHRKSISNRN